MKLSNIIIAVVLVLAIVVGWFVFINQSDEEDVYGNHIAQAEALFKEGLYQRAILSWKEAYAIAPSSEIYEKMNEAYKLRYEEVPEETRENYKAFLQQAVNAYPANQTFVDAYLQWYTTEEDSEGVYNCLVGAITNGYDNETLRQQLRRVKYLNELDGNPYLNIVQSIDGYYTYTNDFGTNVMTPDNDELLLSYHTYASLVGEAGVTVVIDEDSRIINNTGIVLGIFEKNVTSAGIFAEGLVPAVCEGKYAYYNEFAKKQFGDYEYAGTFQNGKAAVKKDGKWMLVDTKGEQASDTFAEIVLDNAGRYIVAETIMVKTSDGKYALYDAEWNHKATLDCEDVDVMTADGLIAVCKGGKWGYMNTSGEMVIQPEYDSAKSFSNCSAAVCKDGTWGFIDAKNNLVIPFQYTDAGYMDSNGVCPVRLIDVLASETPTQSGEPMPWRFLRLKLGVTRDGL